MSAQKPKVTENNNKPLIKTLYKQIREGCSRKICYNIYCHNNLICNKSKQIKIIKLA